MRRWLELGAVRSDAEADFGLALPLGGDDSEGLHWLHSAQGRCETQPDVSRLVRCLTNEAEFQRHKKNRTETAALVERIQSIEQR